MLDLLKNLAQEKLLEAMAPNSLGENETQAAAQEGAGALVSGLMEQLQGGGLSNITELFSGNTSDMASNGLFQAVAGQLTNILQQKGMSAEDAASEAQNVAPGLMEGLKDKFLSQDEADSGFDIGAIAGLLGGEQQGGIGGMINVAKNLFGK